MRARSGADEAFDSSAHQSGQKLLWTKTQRQVLRGFGRPNGSEAKLRRGPGCGPAVRRDACRN